MPSCASDQVKAYVYLVNLVNPQTNAGAHIHVVDHRKCPGPKHNAVDSSFIAIAIVTMPAAAVRCPL